MKTRAPPAIADYPAFLAEWDGKARAPRAPDAPKVVSTFAGAGRSSLGWLMAGFDVVLATDFWPRAAETYLANRPGATYLVRDVADLAADEVLDLCGLEAGELDVLDGSPPCQGFSTAGNLRVADPRNSLYGHFVRLLGGLKPKAFVMENVPGLVRGRMRPLFREMTAALKGAGYRVRCRKLDAQWFGVPQARERLIWVGVRGDLDAEPAHPPPAFRPVSVAEALADLLPGVVGQASPFRRKDWVRATKNEMHSNEWKPADGPSATVTANRPPVALLDDGRKRGWSADRPSFTVGASRRLELHSPEVLRQWEEGRRYVGSFHAERLDPGAPAGTQVAAHRDWHWAEARQLTDRECARLQSFPDSWRFRGNKSEVMRQVGNAVPPLMMAHVAAEVGRSVLGFVRGGGG